MEQEKIFFPTSFTYGQIQNQSKFHNLTKLKQPIRNLEQQKHEIVKNIYYIQLA